MLLSSRFHWKRTKSLPYQKPALQCQCTLKKITFPVCYLMSIISSLLTMLTRILSTNHRNLLSGICLQIKELWFSVKTSPRKIVHTVTVNESMHLPPVSSVVAPVPWMVKDSKSSRSQQISEKKEIFNNLQTFYYQNKPGEHLFTV